jgi:hypothetical protein
VDRHHFYDLGEVGPSGSQIGTCHS